MKNELKELSEKVDKILEMQELILNRLNQSTILTKEPVELRKKPTKKEETNKRVEEYMLAFEHGHRLQAKFNLAVLPHENRILAYLRTNDESIFDGLKRNNR